MTYNHLEIEKKWQKFWADNKTFEFNPNDKREKFYALSMFPYPSGELHAGHLKNFAIGDILARYKRMQGYNVLQPMGADAFGLPAENAAIKRKIHPSEWTKKNLDSFLKDMLNCGLSYDMSRIFATCDPEYYGFQQEIFIKMYEQGLIVQKESYVNWDPVDKTVLANEQVINGRGWRSDALVERKLLKQWFIKITDYAEELLQNLNNGALEGWPEKVRIMQENWIGKSEGALVEFEIVSENELKQNNYLLTIKENFKGDNIKQQALQYYKDNIQKTFIERDIGNIKFSNKGKYEFFYFVKNNALKLNIVPHLKDIVKKGFVGEMELPNHERSDGIIAFIPIYAKIRIDDRIHIIEILLSKDNRGIGFYDMFIDFERQKKSIKENLKNKMRGLIDTHIINDLILIVKSNTNENGLKGSNPYNYLTITKDWNNALETKSKFVPITDDSMNQNISNVKSIQVYTTRPDTLFGASFLGISADHPLAKEVASKNKGIADFITEIKKGSVTEEEIETMEKKGIFTDVYVKNPFLPEQFLPVYIANFILMDYGTGAIFGCPAHDERDYEFAKKYDLPINRVVASKEKYNKMQELLDMRPVASVNSAIAEDDNFIENIIKYYKEIGSYVENKYVGKVKLTKNGIKDSLYHENTKIKIATLKVIPEIIKNGIFIMKNENWKNRKYDTILLSSVIKIDNEEYIAEILVIEYKNKDKIFYLHNVINKKVFNGIQKGVLKLSSPVRDTSMLHKTPKTNTSLIKSFVNVNKKTYKSLIIKYYSVNLPFIEQGIAINSGFLNGLPTKEAKAKAIDKIEQMGIGSRKINYRLRDWGVSRQRYWGCPIPMVHCEHCGVVPEKLENLPIKLPEDVVFDGKGNPLDNHTTWKHCKCPICGNNALRETDTMDTFVDSSWYFARFVDLDKKSPVNKELCNKIMPIDQYVGGIEHAVMHLMYARFFTKAMADLGYFDKSIREPAKRLLNQGMVQQKAYRGKNTNNWENPKNVEIRDNKFYSKITGEELICEGIIKMSKSKSNVVGISDFMDEFGADSARLFIMSDNPITGDFEWTAEGIKNTYKYLNKIYKLVVTTCENDNKGAIDNVLLVENHKAIKDITQYMEDMEYNKAIARIREFTNNIERANGGKLFAVKNLVKLLAPFTPHLCEELNEVLGEKITLDRAEFPKYDEKMTIDSEVVVVIQINGKVRGEIKVAKDTDRTEIEKIAKQNENAKKYLEEVTIKKVIVVPNKLISFVV